MTVPMTTGAYPLTTIAEVPAAGQRWRRSIVLASGQWAGSAGRRAADQLDAQVGLTRASSTHVYAFAPDRVLPMLDKLTDVDPLELAGAKLAAQACTDLTLFLAECRVLWHQRADLVSQS